MALTEKILWGIAKEIAKSQIKNSINNYKRDHQVLKTLKRYGFAKLEKDFDSIYAHTLVEFGEDRNPPELVYLFAIMEVKTAFKEDIYQKTASFNSILEEQLHTNRALPQELKNIPSLRAIKEDITEFIQLFDYYTTQTASLVHLRLHNKQYEGMLQLLEENEKKSFEYQAKVYLENKRKEFQEEFLEKDLYIPLKAEKRAYITQQEKGISKKKRRCF